MATFAYEVIREPGSTIQGEIEADDSHSAAVTLVARGYHVLHIEDANARAAARLKPRLGIWGGLKRRDLVRFTRDMAHLLRAGLPLSQALNKLRARAGDSGWRGVAGGLRARLEDGQTFSQALGAYPEIFDPMYVSLVRAGEEGGKLAEVMDRLAELGERRDELQSRVKMALVYPAAMLTLGAVTVFVLVSFVVPMFTSVFSETGQMLPLPTRVLVDISGFLSAWWWVVLPIAGILVFACVQFCHSPQGKLLLDKVFLRIPLLKRLVSKNEVAAFSRTLGTLLGSGIPIVTALEITAKTLKNVPYSDAVQGMSVAVREGSALSEAVDASPLFSDMVGSVIAVGEESGDLSNSLHQIADENEREVERETKVIMTLIEPLMIILIGSIVGFIVMAMLLPIFELGDTIRM